MRPWVRDAEDAAACQERGCGCPGHLPTQCVHASWVSLSSETPFPHDEGLRPLRPRQGFLPQITLVGKECSGWRPPGAHGRHWVPSAAGSPELVGREGPALWPVSPAPASWGVPATSLPVQVLVVRSAAPCARGPEPRTAGQAQRGRACGEPPPACSAAPLSGGAGWARRPDPSPTSGGPCSRPWAPDTSPHLWFSWVYRPPLAHVGLITSSGAFAGPYHQHPFTRRHGRIGQATPAGPRAAGVSVGEITAAGGS